jgi:hypothetical protein
MLGLVAGADSTDRSVSVRCPVITPPPFSCQAVAIIGNSNVTKEHKEETLKLALRELEKYIVILLSYLVNTYKCITDPGLIPFTGSLLASRPVGGKPQTRAFVNFEVAMHGASD